MISEEGWRVRYRNGHIEAVSETQVHLEEMAEQLAIAHGSDKFGEKMVWASGTGGNGVPWWVAAILALGTPIAGAISGVVVYFSTKRKEARKDTIDEWQEIAHRTQERVDKLEVEVRENKAAFEKESRDTSTRHEKEISDLRVKSAEEIKDIYMILERTREQFHNCEKEKIRQEGIIKLLQDGMRRLEVKQGLQSPPSVLPGVIVADLEGIVYVVSPVITSLFHWFADDLIGESVEKIVAPSHKEEYLKIMEEIRETSNPPWPSRIILSSLLTKEGGELPVSVALSGWQTRTGDRFINAEISLMPDPDSLPKPSQISPPTSSAKTSKNKP